MRRGDPVNGVGVDRKKWPEEQPDQFSAPRGEVVAAVNKVLVRYTIG